MVRIFRPDGHCGNSEPPEGSSLSSHEGTEESRDEKEKRKPSFLHFNFPLRWETGHTACSGKGPGSKPVVHGDGWGEGQSFVNPVLWQDGRRGERRKIASQGPESVLVSVDDDREDRAVLRILRVPSRTV